LYSGVGTVKALDLNNLTVTLDHGPIPALNWPAMVMDFQVEGADLLEGLAVGDRVTFDFRAQRSTFLIIDLEKQR
jgi:Cu/Ag efflux protein CusF